MSNPEHTSYVFVLEDDDSVHPLPHEIYLSLARAQSTTPAWAGRTLRLADWYVRLKDGRPESVANESYSLVRFDEMGRIDWAASPHAGSNRPGVDIVPEEAAWPTPAQRQDMQALVFDGAEPFATPPTSPQRPATEG
jgi:hypothetical protein